MRVLNKRLWPYQVNVPSKESVKEVLTVYDERYVWLMQNLPRENWRMLDDTFCFKKEDDCLLFVLRWS